MNRLVRFVALAAVLIGASHAVAQEETVLVGDVAVQDILMLPGWFSNDYLKYNPSQEYMAQLRKQTDGLQVLCFLGTWCSDSKLEVPRMIKIIQALNLPPEALRMVGLDREKHSPNREEDGYGVEKVPTFIVFRNGEELGRIVEHPYGPLEKDLLGILDPQPEPEVTPGVDESGNMPPPDGAAAPKHIPEEEQRRMMEQSRPPMPPPGDARAPQ